jgi:hypothetical protein
MKTRVAMTPQERRNQLDKHNRNIIFSKMAKDKHFKFAAADAEKIYSKFVALKDMQDPDEARALAKSQCTDIKLQDTGLIHLQSMAKRYQTSQPSPMAYIDVLP